MQPAQIPAYDFELQAAEPAGVRAKRYARGRLNDFRSCGRSGFFCIFSGNLESAAIRSAPGAAEGRGSRIGRAHSTGYLLKSPSGNGSKASGAGSLEGPLGDLFEEFRSELGETKEDEDLETHYNLGIAYREMGLLEEAISEFQKVASYTDKGPAFRYAMQCSTLLGLAFMEKGQPAIAAIWYERALKTPGLDQESILALRYDLGVAQELAGDDKAAFNSFSQVYALNIDYRDVSERIALLGKAR